MRVNQQHFCVCVFIEFQKHVANLYGCKGSGRVAFSRLLILSVKPESSAITGVLIG